MPPPPSERLTFRTWRGDQLDLAMALWGDPSVAAFVGGPFSEEQVRDRLALEIETERVHHISYWPVFTHIGEHVGCCGLRPRKPGVPELGFYLRPKRQGKGYALEAARAVIAYAFDHFGATGLFAGHHPDNVASARTLAKLGFVYTHHELYPPTGLQHPCYELGKR